VRSRASRAGIDSAPVRGTFRDFEGLRVLSPWEMALREEAALPSWEVGPVERAALGFRPPSRFASLMTLDSSTRYR